MVREGLILKANARAQRRLRRMVETKAYADECSRESRLYTQAERLVDALLTELTWETRKAELDLLLTHDHDMHVNYNVFVTECEDCCCDPESPGQPAEEFAAHLAGLAPGELVEMYGR
jgi:hypothetical protein